jgi:dipeptidyl aminopeptidase/acylaminoacyl peptidase
MAWRIALVNPMRVPFAIACLFAATIATYAESEKRVITHQDVWLMRTIGAPAVSPDGRWAVVSVTEPAYDPKDRASDLWILSIKGDRPPRRLTANKTSETDVNWSHDSSRIAFSSKRDGDDVVQVYVLDLAVGGEAERVTHLSTGARSPQWSPDGRRLLFVSDVYPGAVDDAANDRAKRAERDRKYNVREYESFPIRHWDRWLDSKRPHLFVQEVQSGAAARDLLAGTQLAAQAGFAGKRDETDEDIQAAWSPDGTEVVFVASTNSDRAAYAEVDTDLFVVGLEPGSEPRRLTQDPDSYGKPVFTPDGKFLVIRSTPGQTGFAYNESTIVRFPWPFDLSQKLDLTSTFERDPKDPVIAGDGTWVYFTAEDAGQEKIYGVDIEGGDTKLEYEPPSGCMAQLAGGGVGESFRLVALWDSAVSPAEVLAYQPGDTRTRQLSQFNSERLAGVDMFPVEHFWIQSSQNRRVHSMIVRPPFFDPSKKYPVIAVIHGGPHTMFRDSFGVRWNYHLLAAPGHVVVLTNYSGSTGFGETFARGVHGDPLRTPASEINETLDEVLRKYPFADATRQAAAGASYGGHIVNWLQATTTRYRCLIAHAGLVNLETQWGSSDVIYGREMTNGGPVWEEGGAWREQNPVRLVGNHFAKTGWVTPIMLTIGEKDFRVPLNNAIENWSYLQRLRVPSRLLVFPDENHWIQRGENSRYWYGEVQAWLARWFAEPTKD